MRERRRYMAALTALVLGGVAFAVFFRANIPEFDFSDKNIRACEFDMLPRVFYEEDVHSAQGIVDASEIIVSARATGVRTFISNEILSEVTVEKVYKGDSIKPGDTLTVFEFIAFGGSRDVGYRLYFNGVSNLMAKDERYILPLKFFERPEPYQYSETDKRMYLFTEPYFGPFPVTLYEEPLILDDTYFTRLRYADTMQYDCVAASQEQFAAYRQIRDDFLKLIASV